MASKCLALIFLFGCELFCAFPAIAQSTSAPQIIIDSVRLEGAPHLANGAREQLVELIKRQKFEGGSDEWVVNLNTAVLNAVPDGATQSINGVCTSWRAESRDFAGMHVAVTVRVSEAPPRNQYRLTAVSFRGATAFPAPELQGLVPGKNGSAVTSAGLGAAISATEKWYELNGYLYFTYELDYRFDKTHKTKSAIVDIHEGQQYRIGAVYVHGLSPDVESALRAEMKTGVLVNRGAVRRFYLAHKSDLPSGAAEPDVQYRAKADGTVDITIDFRPPSERI